MKAQSKAEIAATEYKGNEDGYIDPREITGTIYIDNNPDSDREATDEDGNFLGYDHPTGIWITQSEPEAMLDKSEYTVIYQDA